MGKLIGIARAPELRAALEELETAEIGREEGLVGDARGRKLGRQITVVFREGWEAACRDLGAAVPWTARRANLFVEDVPVPSVGAHLNVGGAVLEVTRETDPCSLMDQQHMGLRRALTPEWRGGVCCNVVRGGPIRLGDAVEVAA